MLNYFSKTSLFIIVFCFSLFQAKAENFNLVNQNNKVSIVYAADGAKLDSIAANLLAADIQRVSGYLPKVYKALKEVKGDVIIIGDIKSVIIKNTGLDFSQLNDKWECYRLQTVLHPYKNIDKALVIAGSDHRGTAYGVFSVSEKIGVSPWYWWADVAPIQKKELSIEVDNFTSETPSVMYRGIFINDEDWGLQPWAAKTFEPETGDIGPKTYAKVFELILRLKGNLVWPAMHPSTKAFYHYPKNKLVAADYEMVIGSSHAEPMLRNNVDEWKKTNGDFNYITNKQKVYEYWESRVKESKSSDAIYTMGMRGVHDSGIEGVKTAKETVPLLERIFEDQRDLLRKYINKDITAVPQVLVPYKEVLDVYDSGLKVPDDITLVWPDDNYGYIRRLNNAAENERSGGAGVYYHASYWGRPHDYLWITSTHPALIREEMMKAYDLNSKNVWVLNVGDIKPAEYDLQFFMDMAYHAQDFKNSDFSKKHLEKWMASNFNEALAPKLAEVMWQYYHLAFERKPEFMGWSTTEPTTQTNFTAYNHFFYGDQAQKRIDNYDALQQEVKTIAAQIPATKKDAFYQLIAYPVNAAANMNKKFLYRDKAEFYAKQGRLSAINYKELSQKAYNDIVKETTYYNTKLANGKWANIMSMEPRNLPVYKAQLIEEEVANTNTAFGIAPEGLKVAEKNSETYTLPLFDVWNKQKYFVDIFLSKETTLKYQLKTSEKWITLSESQGTLSTADNQKRLWIAIDWNKAPKQQMLEGKVTINADKQTYTINVKVNNHPQRLEKFKGFVPSNAYIAINAANFSEIKNTENKQWQITDGLGYSQKALMALPLKFSADKGMADTANIRKAPALTYNFYNFEETKAEINIFTLPTLPINEEFKMRYAVGIDGGALQILDFKTEGRSEEWKKNVLSNTAKRTIHLASLKEGSHKLTVYMVDPGVILDKIYIDLGAHQAFYGNLPETKKVE